MDAKLAVIYKQLLKPSKCLTRIKNDLLPGGQVCYLVHNCKITLIIMYYNIMSV